MQEWIALLREMALSFSTIPALKEYEVLVNTDPEVDFFYNIVHLQVGIFVSLLLISRMVGSLISIRIVLSSKIPRWR